MITFSIDLYQKAETIAQAKAKMKKFYDLKCIISGDRINDQTGLLEMSGEYLDGCHIYDAGLSRFSHLKRIPLNILPMSRTHHKAFDWIKYQKIKRDPVNPKKDRSKVEWLIEMVDEYNPELKATIVYQIEALQGLIK